MSPELIVLISLAVFGVMLMAEAPVAAALLTASITGLMRTRPPTAIRWWWSRCSS